jgi:hypothetical protein
MIYPECPGPDQLRISDFSGAEQVPNIPDKRSSAVLHQIVLQLLPCLDAFDVCTCRINDLLLYAAIYVFWSTTINFESRTLLHGVRYFSVFLTINEI